MTSCQNTLAVPSREPLLFVRYSECIIKSHIKGFTRQGLIYYVGSYGAAYRCVRAMKGKKSCEYT